VCSSGPGLLVPANVAARGVDFVVALALEVVEAFGVFVVGGDAAVGAKGHETEYYTVLGGLGEERHGGDGVSVRREERGHDDVGIVR